MTAPSALPPIATARCPLALAIVMVPARSARRNTSRSAGVWAPAWMRPRAASRVLASGLPARSLPVLGRPRLRGRRRIGLVPRDDRAAVQPATDLHAAL